MRWVSAEGGAIDRVAVFSAVLMGLCALFMSAVMFSRQAWVPTGFWLLVLALSLVVGWRSLRRVRGLGRTDPGGSA